MKRLSVVICNFNYEQYVGQAIESALDVRWDDVEVVVVDDGSTDGSADVVGKYEGRVTVVFAQNGTQRVAANRGYALTTGDVVVFLDSDDVLPPDLAEKLSSAWTPEVSKAQFRMQRIDETGHRLGAPFPRYDQVPTPSDIRRWASATSAYPTPPGSGNAYARWYLDRIFPLGPETGDFADSACLAAAPFLGQVVTVSEVVVGYRQHGANDSNLLKNEDRFAREVARAHARWVFAQRARDGDAVAADEAPLFRSRELLQLRVAAARVGRREAVLPGDGRTRMALDCLRAPFHAGPERTAARVAISAWSLATLLAPSPFARRLLRLRYGRRREV